MAHLIIIYVTTAITLLIGGILLVYAGDNFSRRYLSILLLVIGGLSLIQILFNGGNSQEDGCLSPVQLQTGCALALSLCLYPLMVVRPGWLTMRRLLWILFPFGIMQLTYILISGIKITYLASLSELPHCLEFPDVWVRCGWFVLAHIYTLSLSLLPLYLCRHLQQESIHWLYWLCLLNICTTISFDYLVLVNNVAAICFNRLFLCATILFLFFQALYADSPAQGIPKQYVEEPLPAIRYSSLIEKLMTMMQADSPWRDSALTLPQLATMLGTNRSTLSLIIRDQGFGSFPEFINHYRIDEFKRLVNENSRMNISDAWYTAGFRSKSTFYRYFYQHEGMTPSDYVQKLRKL